MSSNNKVKILMVDDSPKNLITLEAVLTSDDYELISASSGEEALKYILLHDFAVILLDVQMPRLNGFETAKLIKQRKSTQHIPIIFITAISKSSEHVSLGYSTGAVDYIFKPFNPDILKKKVETFVQLHKKQEILEEKHRELEQKTKILKEDYINLEEIIDKRTSELVIANRSLQASQEHFQKIFQFCPHLMAIRSLKDRRYINVNKSWSDYTGYALSELIEKNDNIIEITASNATNKNLQLYPLDLRENLVNERITYMTKSGDIRHGLLSTENVQINGEECIISSITDLTEQHKLENELTRLDRLNLVGEMAAGIAHEIRNPMTTVLGFLQLAKQDNQFPTSHEYINLMLDELHRANGIITEFLTLAKNKNSDLQPENINSIIKAIFPLLQAEALLRDNDVELDLTECPLLLLDEKEIRQLILNIGKNGLQAMKGLGVITIRTYISDNEVILEIADEGPGIKDELIEKVGTPFFTTKDEGTGLGMAICYSIAARHKAHIEFQTGPRGTTFFIHFPMDHKG